MEIRQIHLQQILPEVFAGRDVITSDIWHQDLTFEKGQHYLLEAASGTGKSSLCSYLYGYRCDYQGLINFNDQNIRSLQLKDWTRIRRKNLSLLFQELRLFPELTVMENILLKNKLTHYKKKKEIVALLEQMGIADKENTLVGKLSYGQQQRVAFIRCLCQPADFFLLDEPISHLDDENGHTMSSILLQESMHQGSAIIVTSIGKHLDIPYDKTFKL